jgi:hypothetical protein
MVIRALAWLSSIGSGLIAQHDMHAATCTGFVDLHFTSLPLEGRSQAERGATTHSSEARVRDNLENGGLQGSEVILRFTGFPCHITKLLGRRLSQGPRILLIRLLSAQTAFQDPFATFQPSNYTRS